MATRLTTPEVNAMLQARFGGSEKSAILFEVRDGTGASASRSIDAVTMTLWPSLGLELTGMEVKVSRSDWLREMKNPAKASATFEYFDRWYLVASRDVANMDEIPGPWGWMAPEDGKLALLKKAPLNQEPRPIDRKFLASLLRTAGRKDDALVTAAVRRAEEEVSKRLTDQHRQRVEAEVERRMRDVQAEAKRYEELRKALGDGTRYIDDGQLVEAVRILMASGILNTWGGLAAVQRDLSSAADKIRRALNQLKTGEQ